MNTLPLSRATLITMLCAACWISITGSTWAAAGASREAAYDLYVSEAVVPHILDVDLRQLPLAPVWKPGDPVIVVEERSVADFGIDPDPNWVDPVKQASGEGRFSTTVEVSFPGIPFGGGTPPDTVGDVGPDHYIQMVNSSRFAIWDKQGVPIVPVTALSSLWDGGTSACADGDGDPIVQYDHLADRWLMSELDISGNTFCIYVSRGPNPVTDGWYAYDYSAPSLPDYPKYGVWPDAYYASTFESPFLGIYAFDRVNMLSGLPATFQRFTVPQLNGSASRVTRILPADVDGLAPPAGAPNYFMRTVDNTQDFSDPTDRIEIWEYVVDFATPANSSLTLTASLATAPFTLLPCSPGTRDCVPQPGTGELLDALFNRPLRRLQYRNFGSHETMVFSQVVDAGFGIAGKRWWELRKVGAGSWAIHQEGTYSPDFVERFMGSAAMNAAGEIALGYSVSDAVSVLPGIRATARLANDPPGTMTLDELTIIDGIGVQTSSQRWGDYSSMNVDPADGLTFWYTNQLVEANGLWTTHVASFSLGGLFVDGFESGDTTVWSTTIP